MKWLERQPIVIRVGLALLATFLVVHTARKVQETKTLTDLGFGPPRGQSGGHGL